MERKIKNITIVSHYYPPHIGGIEFVASDQAKRLVARGHTVTVVTSRTGSEQIQETIEGVNVIRVKAWNYLEKWGIPFPLFSPKLLSTLSRNIKTSDVVHIHDALYLSSFFGALVARLYKKPIVLTQHVALITHSNPLVVFIEKIVYATSGALVFHFSSSIIVINERVKDFLLQRGVPARKCITLSNAVDTDLYQPVSVEAKKMLRKKVWFESRQESSLICRKICTKKRF